MVSFDSSAADLVTFNNNYSVFIIFSIIAINILLSYFSEKTRSKRCLISLFCLSITLVLIYSISVSSLPTDYTNINSKIERNTYENKKTEYSDVQEIIINILTNKETTTPNIPIKYMVAISSIVLSFCFSYTSYNTAKKTLNIKKPSTVIIIMTIALLIYLLLLFSNETLKFFVINKYPDGSSIILGSIIGSTISLIFDMTKNRSNHKKNKNNITISKLNSITHTLDEIKKDIDNIKIEEIKDFIKIKEKLLVLLKKQNNKLK